MVGYQENNGFTALGSQEWQDIYKDKETEQTKGFKMGAGLNPSVCSEPLLSCIGDGQAERWGQGGVSICSNVHKCHCDV